MEFGDGLWCGVGPWKRCESNAAREEIPRGRMYNWWKKIILRRPSHLGQQKLTWKTGRTIKRDVGGRRKHVGMRVYVV
jgi:hypothetical protein